LRLSGFAERRYGSCRRRVKPKRGQEVVRESIEPGQRVGGQIDVEAGQAVGELLGGRRAEDREDTALGAEPGKRDDGGAESQLRGGTGDRPMALP
jgi:hypothetical protein